MRPGGRICLLALSAAALVAGCGSDDDGTIPKQESEALIASLDAVQGAIEQGDCEGARAGAVAFAQEAEELPAEVDAEVKNALVTSGARLVELADDPEQCQPAGTTGITGEQPPLEPETVPPPVETEPEEEEPEQPEQDGQGQEDGGNDGGGGGGNDGGGGGGTGGTGTGGG